MIIAGWILLLASGVAGQSDVDRMIDVCHDYVTVVAGEHVAMSEEKRSFADGLYEKENSGDSTKFDEIQRRADEFREFARRRRDLRASWMTPSEKVVMEKVCDGMLISYFEGRRTELSLGRTITE